MLPVSKIRTISEERDQALGRQRIGAELLALLAGLAVILAAVGIFGLVSNSVAQRTREMGIRIAFGATMTQVLISAARPGIVMAAIGVAGGLGLSYVASGLLKSVLYGVQPGDPGTYGVVAVGLLMVAGVASLVPALRVTRLEPARALRDE